MSVSIYRDVNDETVIENIYIDGVLPDISEFANIKRIEDLSIKNIENSFELQQFLAKIPVQTVQRIEITNCDMSSIRIEDFEQWQSIEDISIMQSQGVDYNELLRRITNKQELKKVYFWIDKQNGTKIDVSLLEQYENLEVLGLRNFLEIDMDKLHSVIIKAEQLEQMIIEADIENLDFISGVNLEHCTIMDKNFDVSLITPEIARAHRELCIETGVGNIITRAEGEKGYELEIPIDLAKNIDSVRDLIDGAEYVKVLGIEIQLDNAEELKKLVNAKAILDNTIWFSIKIPHIGILGPNELEIIKKEFRNFNRIIVMDPECEGATSDFHYKPNEYEILQKKVQEIVGDIPQELTDLQKFMIIYERLGSKIAYDYQLVQEEKIRRETGKESEYVKYNKATGRNLVNGLMNGKCVCAGYADILYNCLQYAGINACKVVGEKHAWNKVQIDGVWYNVDLTWDCKAIVKKDARSLTYCLRSDKEFAEGHNQEDGKKVKCDTDYPRREIVKAMRFAQKFNDRALDAEYEMVEEQSIFSRFKSRLMMALGKRKMIESAQASDEVKTTVDRREAWMKKTGIVIDNGEEISQIDTKEESKPRTTLKNREINDD